MPDLIPLTGDTLVTYSLSTALLLTIILLLRRGLHRIFFQRSKLAVDVRRQWTVNIRNTLLFISVIGIVLIWAPHLQTFAVTLLAAALALVIATKEFIDCLVGAGVRALTKAYSIGDRIDINGVRGHVVDYNLLTSTILEIGPGQTSHQYTGRAMLIPNSFLLKYALNVETYSREYRLHIVTIPLNTGDDWQTAESILLAVAREECHSYIDDARRHLKALEGTKWLDAPSVEPRVTIQLPETGRINLLLRVPCPTQYPSRLEQAILRKFLEQFRFAT